MKILIKIFFVLLLTQMISAKTDLSGNWVSECNLLGKHSFKSKISFKDVVESVEFKLYKETTCQTHVLSVFYEASFMTGAKFGEGKKFNSTPSKIQLVIHLPAVVEQFNSSNDKDGCGLKNWKLNVAQSVSGKFCWPFKMPTLGKPVYDIYKLNLNSLVFGGLPIKWDMTDITVRPKQLSKIEFWREKTQ